MIVTQHFNELTEGEAERLAIIMEEMAEAQQVIGKILRHGYGSRHPDQPNGPTNRDMLMKELADVQVAIKMMSCDNNDICPDTMFGMFTEKEEKIKKYLHHQ